MSIDRSFSLPGAGPGLARHHGGPDAGGTVPHDFSTNSNACGPCPMVLAAVRAADAARYPDPSYAALRERLAARHQVTAGRIVLAASASEAIMRITAAAAQCGIGAVVTPAHAYADYALAASAWAMEASARPASGSSKASTALSSKPARAPPTAPSASSTATATAAQLQWWCDPSSPLGISEPFTPSAGEGAQADWHIVDRAYAPLLLQGADRWAAVPAGSAMASVWQLWSPNKALGLTGVRGAYLVAPLLDGDAAERIARLEALAPSWPVGAHGVAMLRAWCEPEAAAWVSESLATLRIWKARQTALCESFGWRVVLSQTSFHCARLPAVLEAGRGLAAGGGQGAVDRMLARLRSGGVKLRDCASFGLPGHVRLGVLPPASQDALAAALRRLGTIDA